MSGREFIFLMKLSDSPENHFFSCIVNLNVLAAIYKLLSISVFTTTVTYLIINANARHLDTTTVLSDYLVCDSYCKVL